MGVNWNPGAMRWMPHRDVDGEYHPLNHLHPFRFDVDTQSGSVSVAVAFAMHCFTRKPIEGEQEEMYQDKREQRAFCYTRYVLSKQLPEIVKRLPGQYIQHGRQDNYVTVKMVSPDTGQDLHYGVFFNMRRWSGADGLPCIQLTVQSAYVMNREMSSPRPGKVGFVRAIELLMEGKKPRPPRLS